MAKKINYTSMTLKEMRKRGRYVEKVEIINPYQIIQERTSLRGLQETVRQMCAPGHLITPDIAARLWRHADGIRPYYGKGLKNDCFGFMDLLAIDPLLGPIAVQSTGPSGHAEHRKKILRNDYARRWVHFDKIELWSWQKKPQKPGSKRLVWTPREELITLKMFIEFAKTDPAAAPVQEGGQPW